jgi:hypothetical protein
MTIGAIIFGIGYALTISANFAQAAMIFGAVLMVFAICASLESFKF